MFAVINRHMPSESVPFFWTKCFSTVGYAVLYSTLVLFIQNGLGASPALATSITGVFVTFNYFLHLVGGSIGGKFISYRSLFVIGMVLELIGSLFIAFSSIENLYIGLSIFLAGCGVYVSSINCILTGMFKKDDSTRRESAFFWVYAGMNFGFFIGMAMGGYFHLSGSYRNLFFISMATNIVGLIIFATRWHEMRDRDTAFSQKPESIQKRHSLYTLIFVLAIIPALCFMFKNPSLSANLVLIVGGAMLCLALMLSVSRKDKAERFSMLAFVVLVFSVIAFWALFYLAPMGMTLFIKYHIKDTIAGFTFAPQWYGNINNLVIIFGAPTLAALFSRMRDRGINVSAPAQFTAAILLMAASFLILPVGISLTSGKLSAQWIIACYVLQAIGELCISPVGYAMVGQLVPNALQGTMMGMWMMTGGIASSLSRTLSLSMLGDTSSGTPPIDNFSHTFNNLGLSMVVVGVLLMLLTPKLNAWIGTPSSRKEPSLQEA